MQARVDFRIKPVELPGIEERIERKEARKESKSRLNRFIRKSVNYYADEEFQKNGAPMRWLD